VILYWYGGEPTSMGLEYFTAAIESINMALPTIKGYELRHVVLTSLVDVGDEWFPFFHKYCDGYFQTSYDGRMRGKKYLLQWEQRVRDAKANGLSVGTLSVINEDMLRDGAIKTIDYLTELGIIESGFLPFMLNEQNKGKKYERFAPSMENWSSFMIESTQYARELKLNGERPPSIGQEVFYHVQSQRNSVISNVAGQTLFLMPNGDLTLPDYRNGYEEYMRVFGNILEESFEDVLSGNERLSYLAKQMTRNNNIECLTCEHSNYCVMEFWKDNKVDDDCFGGKRYLEWLIANKAGGLGDVQITTIC
jgi:sulfatase maturation enzyme AslB (radical SAM superfamily)